MAMTDEQIENLFKANLGVSQTAALRAVYNAGQSLERASGKAKLQAVADRVTADMDNLSTDTDITV